MKRIAAGLVMSSLLVAGCSTDTSDEGPNAYKFAQQACQTSGTQAASLAARAARLDPQYQQLANDEAALVQNLQNGGVSGVGGVDSNGSGSSAQVVADCAHLATALIPGVG